MEYREKTSTYSLNRIGGLFVFLLLAMMALFSLVSVMLGIQVYNRVVGTTENNSASRTSLSYISSKVRNGDEAGMVSFKRIDDMDVVVLGSDKDGTIYNTYIYFLNGNLMEYSSQAELEFAPAFGNVISSLPQFDMALDGDTFLFTAYDDYGNMHQMHLNVLTGVRKEGM